ncbi:MAG TPA: glutamate--tRNA ligase [Candidatus Limnocylindrales bacterium]|nr:glutamate--tRNA ligase [Candidatus Limnocylindrales bacterium]
MSVINPVRVRFAPSPTGYLHIGNARTALFNWLFARHHHGTFILRIEDTDIERSTQESDRLILEDMKWLGLDYDEGPDKGGAFGPYRQSMRLHLYREYAQKLVDAGKAYPCFCTEEELEAEKQKLLAAGRMPVYGGKCRNLSPKEVEERKAAGIPFALRFKVDPWGSVGFQDWVRGEVVFEKQYIGDFVILRSDGIAPYNFAVVIDDALMQITHVIRGEDHISNTPRQLLLYEALGFQPPQFAHLSMILGPDHTRLSKRHGATSVAQYREAGYLPEALINYLALLGWTPESGQEIISREEMIRQFSLKRVSKSAAIFDIKKLNWMSGNYIRNEDIKKLSSLALPYYQRAGMVSNQPTSEELSKLERVIQVTRGYVETLAQLPEHARIFYTSWLEWSEEAKEILKTDSAQRVIEVLREELQGMKEITPDTFKNLLAYLKAKTGSGGKNLYLPVRAALTGQTHGPELYQLMDILGKEECLKRLDLALQLAKA